MKYTFMKLICFILLFMKSKTQNDEILNESGNDNLDWWQTAIIYQVYPRSFKDSDGDGIGDLKGIEQEANYFKWLGIGAIWLNPIYESPMIDFGYDISNYTNIYDKFGTIDDFKSLSKKLKEIGVKLILDFVPNHTSNESVWFQESIKKNDPFTDYYVWKDPKGYNEDGKPIPPNNWVSVFNIDPAWTFNKQRGQFYLHHFHSSMPDLNYRNELVINEMENIMKFWLDNGVDGFRFDAVTFMVENINFPDEEYINANGLKNDYDNLIHSHTKDQPENYKIMKRWRVLLDNYTKTHKIDTRLMLTEVYTNLGNTMKYYGTKKEPISHIPFNFELLGKLTIQSTSYDYANIIKSWLNSMPDGMWANWVIGNHDQVRIATRFGPEMADVLNIFIMMLPGTVVNYYGDELGMENTFIRWDQTVDPIGLKLGKERYQNGSRDGCRTPMQWDDSINAGFSLADKTWLPANSNYWHLNVKSQSKSMNSRLKIYKKLAEARKLPTLKTGDFNIYTPDDWTIIVTRILKNQPSFITVMNIGSESSKQDLNVLDSLNLPDELHVYTSSINSIYQSGENLSSQRVFWMRPKSALVLTTSEVRYCQK